MDCITPGFSILHHLLEWAQTHVHWVGDAIWPSHPFLTSSIFPSIGGFSNELTLHIRWPKYWTFSFSISPSSEYSGLISFRTACWVWRVKASLPCTENFWITVPGIIVSGPFYLFCISLHQLSFQLLLFSLSFHLPSCLLYLLLLFLKVS